MTTDRYDLIVVGVGGVGSAALSAGVRRGWKVAGLEQFGSAHDRGSSHGHTRIIRQAYYEHPDYVPLAQAAVEAWKRLEHNAACDLFHSCGLLQLGAPDSPVIQGVRRSAETHRLTVEELAAQEVEKRWPHFRVPADMIGLWEPSAGYLRVERGVAQHIRLARQLGAEFWANSPVTRWEPANEGGFVIHTPQRSWKTERLILTQGSWAAPLLSELGIPLRVIRKQQQWFQVDRHEVHEGNGGCCFLVDEPQGCFYGFPQIDLLGFKVAEHSGGQNVTNPADVDRQLSAEDVERVTGFLDRMFRFGKRRLSHFSVCMYTKSPDEHFIVDRHPHHPGLAFAAGLSGHGYKFAPVLGEQLVELVDGGGQSAAEFLRLKRLVNAPLTRDESLK